MTMPTPPKSDADRALRIDDFVNASLLLDEWLDWMSSLCGHCSGTAEPYFVRSRLPRLALVPRLEPPPDEENRNRMVAYGLAFFSGWHESVQTAVSYWSHRFMGSTGSGGAVPSTLIRVVDSVGSTNPWGGFPESAIDPSAHEAVLWWFANFVRHVQNLRLPVLSDSTVEMFYDNRCWPADSLLESHFGNWLLNRNDAARLAAIMEGERRILYQAWELQATTESLPDYDQLWRRDRRLSLAIVEAIARLDKPLDRDILKSLSREQPCKRIPLCRSVCGNKPNVPGNFNASLKKIMELNLVSSGGGRSSPGYSLTDFGNEVAVVLNGLEPTTSTRHSDHG